MRKFFKDNWALIIISVPSLFLIGIYIGKMHSYSISSDPKDWASFGAFLAPIVSLITMIILIKTIQNVNFNEDKRLNSQRVEKISDLVISMFEIVRNNEKVLNKLYAVYTLIEEQYPDKDIPVNKKDNYMVKELEFRLKEFMRNKEDLDAIYGKIKSKVYLYYPNKLGYQLVAYSLYYVSSIDLIYDRMIRNMNGNLLSERLNISLEYRNYLKETTEKILRDLERKVSNDEISNNEKIKYMGNIFNKLNKDWGDKITSIKIHFNLSE